jgi:SAM-dependent methyltransferase
MVKFLDVGSGPGTNAIIFKDRGELEVTRMDGNPDNHPDVVHDILQPFPDDHRGAYDLVLASHVLEHVDYRQVAKVLRNIVEAAQVGGEVWIFVPCMEWAARQILHGHDDIGLQATIFGGQGNQWDYHKVGFTKTLLVAAMRGAGCRDVQVGEAGIIIVMDGINYTSYQNHAQGFRER